MRSVSALRVGAPVRRATPLTSWRPSRATCACDAPVQALPEYIAFMEKQLQWHGVLDLCEAQQEEADTHQRYETEPSSEACLPDAVDVTAAVSTPEDGDASADQIAQQEQDAQKAYVAGWFDRLLCASRVRRVPTPPRRLAAESWARLTAPVGS